MGKDKKRNRIIDKVLMGAIIGGAIGSVVGASIAPKEGKKTREELVGMAKMAKEESKSLFKKIKRIFIKETKKEIPHEHV